MITELPQKFPIEPIIEQVNNLGNFGKRLDLNSSTGQFFNDPWKIKSDLIGTPLGNVLESLGDIGQARLLRLESAESYTAHYDPDDRIHLAIITNPYSFLVNITDNKLYHIPADGRLWHMNTGKLHVASNWGAHPRIHLNIRVLLPHFNGSQPGVRFKILTGNFDWKQEAYTEVMGLINYGFKQGLVSSFKALSETELLINCTDPNSFKPAIDKIISKGIKLEFEFF
jgi:hypothetical protein